ncbi:MAG: hypothetical protein GWO24_08580, partial [Akkermansiaceae bacterium]|nr:hypothetical protein [Akkermansiaceae bacterium]
MTRRLPWLFRAASIPVLTIGLSIATAQDSDPDLLAGHPRESYRGVENLDAMEAALRKSMADQERHSFSRSWWRWDRLRCRYVDGGRVDEGALRILRAVFRGLILDRHRRLEAKGEGDLLYLFHTTLTGDRKESVLEVEGRRILRDVHGGGYHGGWGGAARMRIYEELANRKMLTAEEQERFRRIVHQSLEARFIDFKAKAQTANNHSFGNAGGVALALRLFPDDAPQAAGARAWIDRIWNHLAGFGDWTEWNYYPYGPIFLHGMVDIAEATGRIETDRDLINAVGRRCLGFVHGGGVRGNPNSGAPVRGDVAAVHADPWNVGYYDVETSARDGHFWYRLARHYKDPEYLWAAEQVALGGRPPDGRVPAAYQSAYNRRFAWFVERKIEPRVPASRAAVGLLSATNKKIPERLYLNSGRTPGQPFASFFLYDQKDEHLDNVSGHLYEFAANGAKFLHTSGKYNNVYGGDQLRGGGTGEESLDLLLVLHQRHPFPVHPDRRGDQRDFMRRGSIKHLPDAAVAQNNDAGDSFGQFAFDHYYGPGSRWIRRAVLTAEGYLVVADHYTGDPVLGTGYRAGPVWHLGVDENTRAGPREANWFDAPAFDHAWWQKEEQRILLYFHDDGHS